MSASPGSVGAPPDIVRATFKKVTPYYVTLMTRDLH